MINDIIKEYARTLFEHASNAGTTHEYWNGLQIVLQAIREEPEIVEYFAKTKKADEKWIDEIVHMHFAEVPDEIVILFKKLCRNGLTDNMVGFVAEYRSLMDASASIVIARVRSSVYLSYAKKKKLHQKLREIHGCPVIMDCSTDKTIKYMLSVEINGVPMNDEERCRMEQELATCEI